MKKQILYLAGLCIVSALMFQQVECQRVSYQNNTNAPVKMWVTWSGGGSGDIEIQPGGSGAYNTPNTDGLGNGGMCPWFIGVKDTGTLNPTPGEVHLNYSTGDHCKQKSITINRQDTFASGGSYNVNVMSTGGGNVSIPQQGLVTGRRFAVNTSPEAHVDSGDGGSTLYGAGGKCPEALSNAKVSQCPQP